MTGLALPRITNGGINRGCTGHNPRAFLVLRAPPIPSRFAQAAMLLQQRLESMLQGVALGAARYGAALLVLGWGLLSGRRPITAALVASLLWLGMVLGELRIISQVGRRATGAWREGCIRTND